MSLSCCRDLYLRVLKATVGGEGGDLAGILGDVTVEERSWIEEVLRVLINALHFPLKVPGHRRVTLPAAV